MTQEPRFPQYQVNKNKVTENGVQKLMIPSLLCLLFSDAFSDHACVFLCVSMYLEVELLTHEEIRTQCRMITQEWMTTQYNQASDTCMANRPNIRGNPTAHRTQPSLPTSQALAPCARQPDFRATSPSFRSKVHAVLVKTCARRNTTHIHPLCAQRTSPRASDSPDKVQHQLSPPKMRIPIPCYTSCNTILTSYTPLPRVMNTLTLQTSLILVVEFHAVCRSTICGAHVDSEARIPGITMTVRVDIFTKTVTSNPKTNQPKFPNQLYDSHPDLIEHTTNVYLIPSLTTNTDTRKQTRSTEIQTQTFPSALSDPSSSSPQTHSSPHT